MSTQIPNHIQYLIDRYLDGSATSEELDRLDNWFHSDEGRSVEIPEMEVREKLKKRIKTRVMSGVTEDVEPLIHPEMHGRLRLPSPLRIAGAVALLVTIGYFVMTLVNTSVPNGDRMVHFSKTDDVPAPATSAYLVRKNNSTVDLSRIISGEIEPTRGIELIGEQTIRFAPAIDSESTEQREQLRVVVPRGNVFEMVLPDGSRVALNADSRLDFPSRFDADERHVSLVGEGFFDVQADSRRPFVVHTEKQEIRVTGTQFNVSAYAGELTEYTALVEGEVSLKNLQTNQWFPLNPGEAGTVTHESTAIAPFSSPEHIVAWKSNIFVFEQESIESILRKVSRWYDVEFEWKDKKTDLKSTLFSGKIRRQAGLKEVLTMLSLVANVDFHQQSDRLLVSERQTIKK